MFEEIKDIAYICKKHFNLDLKVDERIRYFYAENANRFQSFLIHDRIRPFQKLMILDTMMNERCLIGSADLVHYHLNERFEEEEAVSLGANIIDSWFDADQVFRRILKTLDFPALLVQGYADAKLRQRRGKHSIILPPPNKNERFEKEIIITKEVVIATNFVYCSHYAADFIASILKKHNEMFNAFLTFHRERSVPHELYIKWLQHWFAGKIHVRKIE